MASAGRIGSVRHTRVLQASTGSNRTAGVPLIFELSSEGRRGTDLVAACCRRSDAALKFSAPNSAATDLPGFPELSEPQVLRHFLRLSQLNFAQALEFYPLGSCTMKYNPVVNDEIAALTGWRDCIPRHPRIWRRARSN